MLNLRSDGDGILLLVKVVPGASRTRYLGEWQGRARVAVAAPPEKGKANRAVIEILADHIGIPRRDLAVVAGHGSALKTIRIAHFTTERLLAALQS